MAGAAFPHAFAQTPSATDGGTGDEVAFAMPRLHDYGGGEAALPQPLAPGEARRVRRIFALQLRGEIPTAISETGRLEDTTLLGALLADRYLRRPATASDADLITWLSCFADQADAAAIRPLLAARQPAGAAAAPPVALPAEERPADAEELPRNPALDQSVRARARDGEAAAALRLIDRTRGLSHRYSGQLRAEVAQALLTQNRDVEALAIALSGLSQSRGEAPLAGYVAGLAAWRLGRVGLARSMLEGAWRSPRAGPGLRAAAAFWAARTYLRGRDVAGSLPWLRRAAAERQSFYGLLARRALGMRLGRPALDGSPAPAVLSIADVEAIDDTPQGRRAFALLQVGQTERARAELRALAPQARGSADFARSLMLVARKAGLADVAAECAALLDSHGGTEQGEPDLRLPKLAPRGGFQLDPALVYALARLESNFDSAATSSAGARGLMQIMPLTAGFIEGNLQRSAAYRVRLHDPAFNLQLGQRYVLYLAQHDAVAGSLIHLLASYNAGPGNLQKWAGVMQDHGDPLMFIECIPIEETRRFVQQALAYSWIYAAQLGLPAPSIDELAVGAWPRFHPGVLRRDAAATRH